MNTNERVYVVEDYLKRWRRKQDEVKAAEGDAANVAFSQGSGDPVQSSSISDKTARGAAILDSVSRQSAWIRAITDAMTWLDEKQPELRKLLYGHYWLWNKHGYTRAHARMFADYFCMEYNVSIRQYHRMRKKALEDVAFIAADRGLFNAALNDRNL